MSRILFCFVLYFPCKEGKILYEWNEAVQNMLDWIEDNLCDNPSLLKMAQQVGYSPYYCSAQFHKICNITIKSYISSRRLAYVALALRDSNLGIMEIALKYGFSSQDALTRAFRTEFGCTPGAYRKNPIPMSLTVPKVVFFPEHYQQLYQGGNMDQAF